MGTLTAIFQILLVYPICVYLFQAVVMKIGTIMAIKKAWDALMWELKLLFKSITWIMNMDKNTQHSNNERRFID